MQLVKIFTTFCEIQKVGMDKKSTLNLCLFSVFIHAHLMVISREQNI
jgi:hypothetical protein